MKDYTFLLFDADGTLLNFDLCEEKALKDTLKQYGVSAEEEVVGLYHRINASLWERFNKGELIHSQLQNLRFEKLCQALGLKADSAEMNRRYMEQLRKHADLMEESLEVCNILYKKYKLYIITNGFHYTQEGRFSICPLTPLFQKIFISEDIGAQKPDKAFFDKVSSSIEGFDSRRALVIGDSLSSDILGANNAGLDCCWYNPKGLPGRGDVHYNYEIRDLRQLLKILSL